MHRIAYVCFFIFNCFKETEVKTKIELKKQIERESNTYNIEWKTAESVLIAQIIPYKDGQGKIEILTRQS